MGENINVSLILQFKEENYYISIPETFDELYDKFIKSFEENGKKNDYLFYIKIGTKKNKLNDLKYKFKDKISQLTKDYPEKLYIYVDQIKDEGNYENNQDFINGLNNLERKIDVIINNNSGKSKIIRDKDNIKRLNKKYQSLVISFKNNYAKMNSYLKDLENKYKEKIEMVKKKKNEEIKKIKNDKQYEDEKIKINSLTKILGELRENNKKKEDEINNLKKENDLKQEIINKYKLYEFNNKEIIGLINNQNKLIEEMKKLNKSNINIIK